MVDMAMANMLSAFIEQEKMSAEESSARSRSTSAGSSVESLCSTVESETGDESMQQIQSNFTAKFNTGLEHVTQVPVENVMRWVSIPAVLIGLSIMMLQNVA